jgi:hypothetical protein
MLLSFSPGFSQVDNSAEITRNRLNGFQRNSNTAFTWLKPGENEKDRYKATKRH